MVSCEGKAGGGQVSPAPRMPCRRAERVRRLLASHYEGDSNATGFCEMIRSVPPEVGMGFYTVFGRPVVLCIDPEVVTGIMATQVADIIRLLSERQTTFGIVVTTSNRRIVSQLCQR